MYYFVEKNYLNAILICIFTFCLSGSAFSKTYSPDYDCQKIDHSSSILVLLCNDSESAKSELILDQAYYALRHQSPAYLLPQLKNSFITDSQILQTCFPDPDEGESPAQCYRQKVARITDKYRSLLMPRAYEEATRPIDDHMALQQRLVDLGYLPPTTKIDSVYGADTRRAILRWQEKTGQPQQDGFLGQEDASRLAPNLFQFMNASHLTQALPPAETAPGSSENSQEITSSPLSQLSKSSVQENEEDSKGLENKRNNSIGGFLGFIAGIIVFFFLIFIGSIRGIAKKHAKVISPEEQNAYQEAGMLWGRWAADLKEGERLLTLLVRKNIDESFAFLEHLLSSLRTDESQKILSDVRQAKKTRRWEEFCRCSYKVLEYLPQYEQEKAEAAERERRQEEAAKKQRQKRERARQRHKHSSSSAEAAPWYVVLGVSQEATMDEITRAYKVLLKKHHPDRFLHRGEGAYKAATEMTARLNTAYGYAKRIKARM